MAVTLPTTILPVSAEASLMRFGIDLVPPLGGVTQRVSRIGSRFRVALAYPPMVRTDAEAMLGALASADTAGESVIALFPQPAQVDPVGSPLVNGGSQSGSSLICDGFLAGAMIPAGTMISFTKSSRIYLHMVTTAATASGAGAATLAIAPMLRVSPADNAALSIISPQVEGLIEGDTISWSVNSAGHYQIGFSLAEAE
jgi:hypothetical protein